jgi:hypothetical protein
LFDRVAPVTRETALRPAEKLWPKRRFQEAPVARHSFG